MIAKRKLLRNTYYNQANKFMLDFLRALVSIRYSPPYLTGRAPNTNTYFSPIPLVSWIFDAPQHDVASLL